jgi:hypothetical protein
VNGWSTRDRVARRFVDRVGDCRISDVSLQVGAVRLIRRNCRWVELSR